MKDGDRVLGYCGIAALVAERDLEIEVMREVARKKW